MTRAAATPNSFLFLAATAQGGKKLGMRQAADQRRLAETLRKDRLLLLRAWKLPAWAVPVRGLKLKDQAELNFQLAQLLTRGVPLVETLEVVSKTVTPAARPRVERMREMVAAGSSFSDAALAVRSFDAVAVAVYRASERTGDLGGAAKQLATTARRHLAVVGKAATLMIYPAIVMTVSIGVSAMMLTLIVPRIAKALRSLTQGNLPWYSTAVFDLGDWLNAHGLWVLVGVAGLLIAAGILRKQVGAAIRAAMRRLPVIRDVVLAQESARFFAVMAAMTRAGVPLADALGTANNAISHPRLRQQLETLRHRLIEGGVLRNLIENVALLPLATRRLLIAAERSGDIGSAFDSLAEDLLTEVERRSSRFLAILEPMLIIGMFLLIGSLIMAIMVPLMSASGRVGG